MNVFCREFFRRHEGTNTQQNAVFFSEFSVASLEGRF